MAGAIPAFSSSTSSYLRHLKRLSSSFYSPITLNVRTTTTPTTPLAMSNNTIPHPSLEVIGGAQDSFLPAFKTLHRAYTPYPVFASNRHVETIFAAFFRSLPDVRFRRECLRTKDDGCVALDWVVGDQSSLPSNSPVLILLPGLTGGSEDTYVRHMLVRARSKGWRVVVFNSRGCGDSPVTTPQFYSASFLGDMSEVVSHVSFRYPKANLYAVGWSLGANILVRYLGQVKGGIEILIDATGLVLSPLKMSINARHAILRGKPFCHHVIFEETLLSKIPSADEDLRKGFQIIYNKALANGLRKNLKKHASLFEEIGGEYNIPLATNAKTIREFDEALTRVSFGFKSVDDYYANSCSSDSIRNVRIPLLCIQAENDPIAPSRGIPREDIKENPNCFLIVTPQGGHLGWVAGADAPRGCPWTDPVVMDFLEHLEQAKMTAESRTDQLVRDCKIEGVQQLEV